jgi:hypothetical protein
MSKNRFFAMIALAAFAGIGACRADDRPVQEVEVYPATETTTPATDPTLTDPTTDPMYTDPATDPTLTDPTLDPTITDPAVDTVPGTTTM